MNILVEGCDNTGKTALINEFLKINPQYTVIKCNAPKDMESARVQYVNIVDKLNDSDNLILDRGMLSECVYAPIFRGYFPEYMRELEKSIENTLLVLVSCDEDVATKRYDGLFIEETHIPKILADFREQFRVCNYKDKITVDTTNRTPIQAAKFLDSFMGYNEI